MNDRLASLTPLVVIALALLSGAMLLVYFTQLPPSPDDMQKGFSGYGWTGPNYADATIAAYVRYSKQPFGTLGYALWVSCVQYHSQLACNEFDLLQSSEEMESKP